jgi:hypothetical protein
MKESYHILSVQYYNLQYNTYSDYHIYHLNNTQFICDNGCAVLRVVIIMIVLLILIVYVTLAMRYIVLCFSCAASYCNIFFAYFGYGCVTNLYFYIKN